MKTVKEQFESNRKEGNCCFIKITYLQLHVAQIWLSYEYKLKPKILNHSISSKFSRLYILRWSQTLKPDTRKYEFWCNAGETAQNNQSQECIMWTTTACMQGHTTRARDVLQSITRLELKLLNTLTKASK